MVEVAVANDMAMMLESIVERLVDTPEDVFVDMKISETGVSLRLTVREEEVGQVIGRQGRTARALRWIVGIAAARAKVPYQLEIVEAKRKTQIPCGNDNQIVVEVTELPVKIEVPWS